MQIILIIINLDQKFIQDIEESIYSKFSEIFFLNFADFLKIKERNLKLYEKLSITDFMIFFNHNSSKDESKLQEIEAFLIDKDLFPEQILIYTNKKNQNLEISKFEYLYEIILKPFNKNLFNAKINSVLRKYFFLKKIKNNLENLAIKTDFFLLSNDEKKKILIIGSDKKNLSNLSKFLSEKYIIDTAHFQDIYQNFFKDYLYSFDLIILNDIDNIHHLIFIFNQIKAHEDLDESVIIFLIKNTDAIFLADVINLGIENYFFWPIRQKTGLLNLISFELKNKSYCDFLNCELQKALESSAIDETTRVFSKKYLINFLEKSSKNGFLTKDLGVIFIDINDFKKINDECGHIFGDFVLKEIAKILMKELKGKIISRFGGDEFVILIEKHELICNDNLVKMIDYLKNQIEKKNFYFNGLSINNVSISIGFVIGSKDSNFLKILEIADKRLYKSKKGIDE